MPRVTPEERCWCWTPRAIDAERLYERSGWQRVGTIPDFALMPDGACCDTVVYYKRLD